MMRIKTTFKLVLALFLLAQVVMVGATPLSLGRSVLALYKSSDNQTKRENEIFFYLSLPLKKMGLSLIYWDIDRGIPPEATTKEVRAVISWFRGPAMRNPESYLDFLDTMLDQGKKVLVMDNFGAYQDAKSQKYLSPARVNATLSKLGLLYQGDWTQDPALIHISRKDAAMVEFQAKQDVAYSRFYYRFLNVDRNLRVYLSLKRGDQKGEPSPVIVTNGHGGFALSRYIYRSEGGKVKLLINPEKFLTAALFPAPYRVTVALLADENSSVSGKILDYTREVLRQAKIPFDVIPSGRFSNMAPWDLRPYTAVGIILSTDTQLNPKILENYLDSGGSAVVLNGGKLSSLAKVLGLGYKTANIQTSGYYFPKGFMLGENLTLTKKNMAWAPGPLLPAKEATILGWDFAQKNPLVWSQRNGKGQVLVWNWSSLATGEFLGFILESFLYVQPVGIAATAALGMLFIDDWPLPMYNIERPAVGMRDTDFYTKVWWPDIKALMKKNQLPYSAFIVFNYNADTSPPFSGGEFYVARGNSSLKIAREILESGNELGLHGYNHMSLTTRGTEINPHRWDSRESMEKALVIAKAEWIRLFGAYSLPVSYVAPHNIISPQGRQALKKIFPSIKVISTLRSGEGEESHVPYGPDKTEPFHYNLPRTSAGYHFNADTIQIIVSSITGPGLFSHFIHADDRFDPYRSQGKSWQQMLKELQQIIDFVKQNYPWLDYQLVRDSYLKMLAFDLAEAEYRLQGKTVTIHTLPGVKYRIRLNGSKIKTTRGAELIYRYKTTDSLIIQATGPTVVIELQ